MIKKLTLQQNLLGLISENVDHPPAPSVPRARALPKTYRDNYVVCNIECSNEILGWEGVGNRQMLCFFKA
jgi:hypothetical protein